MAEIIAKYDTKTKALEITKDGQALANVTECMFCSSSEGFMCQVMMGSKDKDNDTVERHALYASEDKMKEVSEQAHKYLAEQFKK